MHAILFKEIFILEKRGVTKTTFENSLHINIIKV